MFKISEERIATMDAVLTLNFDKNGKKNYIGGATFIEIYEAFMKGKKYIYIMIFLKECCMMKFQDFLQLS